MNAIKGHFDGTSVVLDEPATLAVGQAVKVVVVNELSIGEVERDQQPSLVGFAKGTFVMSDDFNDPIDDFADYR